MRVSFSHRLSVCSLAAVICLMVSARAAQAARIVNVSTSSDLQNAVRNALAGDEIVVAAGTYSPTLFLSTPSAAGGVIVRGATGNPADVIIQGAGMNTSPSNGNTEGFAVYSDDMVIKDLTVQEYFNHAIHLQPGADRITITNVITRNNGQQHIKGARYNTGGLIEKTLCEQTYVRTNMINDPRGVDYVGGIDLHGGIDFIIRDTTVRNIMGQGGDADGSIFAWDRCRNITVERCVVIGGNRAICFGNNSGGSTGYDVDGGIIRNCFVYARTAGSPPADQPWLGNADCAIDVFASRNAMIYNNTIWTDSGSYGRTIRVGVGTNATYGNVNVQFKYNIVRGYFQLLTPGDWHSTGDITGNAPQPNWFFDPSVANLHLTKLATTAIDNAVLLPADVPQDFDKQARPIGSLPDVGADEFVAGDMTGDGHVDIADLLTLAGSWGSSLGQGGYTSRADLNGDNTVDVVDLLILADSWGL